MLGPARLSIGIKLPNKTAIQQRFNRSGQLWLMYFQMLLFKNQLT